MLLNLNSATFFKEVPLGHLITDCATFGTIVHLGTTLDDTQHSQRRQTPPNIQDLPPLPSRQTEGGVASHTGPADNADDAPNQMTELFSAVR